MLRHLTRWARACWSLDVRSLAVYRVLLALSVLFTVLHDMAPFVPEFLSDEPDSFLTRKNAMGSDAAHSLHLATGDSTIVGWLLALEVAAALALLLGWRTRHAQLAVWLLHVSLMNRHRAILHGGDRLIGNFLFYSLFLPLDAAWAVDPTPHPGSPTVLSLGTAAHWAIITQMYMLNWLAKSKSLSWQEASAVLEALGDTRLTAWAGAHLRRLPRLCALLTRATMLVEGPVPLVGWAVPWPALRLVCHGSLIAMHASFVAVFYLGSFPIVCIAGLAALLPGALWTRLLLRLPPTPTPATPGTPATGTPATPATPPPPPPAAGWRGAAADALSVGGMLLGLGWVWLVVRSATDHDRPHLLDAAEATRAARLVADVPWDRVAHAAAAAAVLGGAAEALAARVEGATDAARRLATRVAEAARGAALALALLLTTLRSCYVTSTGSGGIVGVTDDARIARLCEVLWIELPVGMFAQASSREAAFVAAGYTSHAPGEILDFYPWPPRSLHALRELGYKAGLLAAAPPRPLTLAGLRGGADLGQMMPSTRWEKLLATEPAYEPSLYGKLADYVCRRYAHLNLSVVQIHLLHGERPGVLRPHPARQHRWSRTCHDDGDCQADCPWERIEARVAALYASEFVPTAAEARLRPLLAQSGATVRYAADVQYGDRLKPGQHGTFLEHRAGSMPPVRVLWLDEGDARYAANTARSLHTPFTSTYWVHWEQIELVAPLDEHLEMQRVERDYFGAMRRGETRLRMRTDFEQVCRGDEGVYLDYVVGSFPNLKVEWRPANGTAPFVYFVNAWEIQMVAPTHTSPSPGYDF